MQYLRNFSNVIKVVLHIITLTLLVVATIFLFKNAMFIGENAQIEIFKMTSGKPFDTNLRGIYRFGNNFIETSNKSSAFLDANIFTDATLAAAKNLKVLVIVMIICLSLVLIAQLIPFRLEATLGLVIINIILFAIYTNYAINQFSQTELITATTDNMKHIYILYGFAIFISLVNVLFKYLVKSEKSKKINKSLN